MTDGGEVIANTGSGRIAGTYENGQCIFRGVPYASPPVGHRRWLPPQRIEPWNGVRQAKEYGSISPQNELAGAPSPEILSINEKQEEDCLYLNVCTPAVDDARRPVMVWIHGGAFLIGAGSQNMFRSNSLVSRGDIVLVTINYRLGALGFLNLDEITGGRIPATGCEGLLDQVAALDWVRENIQNFGGDPDNITVFGESAGGMSIGCLMALPAAKGKFQKCILQSGAANTVASLEESTAASFEYLDILDLSPDAPDLETRLRSIPVGKLMAAQEKLGTIMASRDGRITPFQPVVDGIVLPEIPINAIKKGSASGVRTLAGTNLDEFKLFVALDPAYRNMDETQMAERLNSLIPPKHVPAVTAAYRKNRAARGVSIEPGEILTAVQSDLMFRIPALNLTTAQENNGQPAYNYLFQWKSPVQNGALGACHALEIGFVFGNYEESFCGTGAEADALSLAIQDAWTAFARTGNPSCEQLGEWKPYGKERNTMILDTVCRIEKAPLEEERAVWDGFDLLFTRPI